MDIFKRIEQPKIVYHMTPRTNLESILTDGKIKTGKDFVCFFFPAIDQIPVYIKHTGAMHGRQYYDFDGRLHTAPPLIPAEHVVLKLIPRYSEPLFWCMEDNTKRVLRQSEREHWTEEQFQEVQAKQQEFDRARIAHYGDMKFRQNEVEVIELAEIIDSEGSLKHAHDRS